MKEKNDSFQTGLDLASDGVIVVCIQSRTNIFGWFSLAVPESPGNLGLLDQRMAFEWIVENIKNFGGDHKQLTLLGHGTSGAPNAMLHLTNPKTASLFSRAIFMSGTIFSTYSYQDSNESKNVTLSNELSLNIIKKLACDSNHSKYILDCLRQKSVNDLLKAFEHIYKVIPLKQCTIHMVCHLGEGRDIQSARCTYLFTLNVFNN